MAHKRKDRYDAADAKRKRTQAKKHMLVREEVANPRVRATDRTELGGMFVKLNHSDDDPTTRNLPHTPLEPVVEHV